MKSYDEMYEELMSDKFSKGAIRGMVINNAGLLGKIKPNGELDVAFCETLLKGVIEFAMKTESKVEEIKSDRQKDMKVF